MGKLIMNPLRCTRELPQPYNFLVLSVYLSLSFNDHITAVRILNLMA